MNFKLKALVAAVALAAVAGQAAADIQAGSSTASPYGELVFYAYGFDASGNAATYVKDLGVAFNTFVTTPSFAATNLSTDANWTAFNSAALVGNKFWGVFATSTTAAATSTAAGVKALLTTATNNDVSGASTLHNNNLVAAMNNANAAVLGINAGGTNYAANSSYFFDTTTNGSLQNLGSKLGNDYGSTGVFFGATNIIGDGTQAHMFDVLRGAGSNLAGVPTVADVAATKVWKFSGANLSYVTAVPEPESYAMLLAGLGLMGFIARRRRAI
jgi:hypothetical protein